MLSNNNKPIHSGKIAKEATISIVGMGFGDGARYLFTAILAVLERVLER